jgi:hypothetical protein
MLIGYVAVRSSFRSFRKIALLFAALASALAVAPARADFCESSAVCASSTQAARAYADFTTEPRLESFALAARAHAHAPALHAVFTRYLLHCALLL